MSSTSFSTTVALGTPTSSRSLNVHEKVAPETPSERPGHRGPQRQTTSASRVAPPLRPTPRRVSWTLGTSVEDAASCKAHGAHTSAGRGGCPVHVLHRGFVGGCTSYVLAELSQHVKTPWGSTSTMYKCTGGPSKALSAVRRRVRRLAQNIYADGRTRIFDEWARGWTWRWSWQPCVWSRQQSQP